MLDMSNRILTSYQAHSRKIQSDGFTIVELLISMALLLPFLGIIVWMMGEISSSQLYVANYEASARESQFASLVIENDLKSATMIDYPATPGGSYSALLLQTPTGAVTIASEGGRLVRTDSIGSAYLLSRRSLLDTFSVSRTGTESSFLQIELGVMASVSGTSQPIPIQHSIAHQLR